jgi:hypothetical protein
LITSPSYDGAAISADMGLVPLVFTQAP